MRSGYRFLEHRADMGLEIISPTLEGVFETAGRALFALIAPRQGPLTEERRLVCEGEEKPLLLVNFLNELLYGFEAEELIYREFTVQELSAKKLVMNTSCERLDPEAGVVERVVKAATFHDLVLQKERGLWRAEVYLDL